MLDRVAEDGRAHTARQVQTLLRRVETGTDVRAVHPFSGLVGDAGFLSRQAPEAGSVGP